MISKPRKNDETSMRQEVLELQKKKATLTTELVKAQ